MSEFPNQVKNKENLIPNPQTFPKIVRKLLPKILQNTIMDPTLGFSFNRSNIIDEARKQAFWNEKIKYTELRKAILARLPTLEKSVNQASSISNNSFNQNQTFGLKSRANPKFVSQ